MITQASQNVRDKIFKSIRTSISEFYSDEIVLEELEDEIESPFIFKSKDAKIWARVFYRSMKDFSFEEIYREIRKLQMMMPADAMLCLFAPELDSKMSARLSALGNEICFFEYAGRNTDKKTLDMHLCKWDSSRSLAATTRVSVENPMVSPSFSGQLLKLSRLSEEEVAAFTDFALELSRIK